MRKLKKKHAKRVHIEKYDFLSCVKHVFILIVCHMPLNVTENSNNNWQNLNIAKAYKLNTFDVFGYLVSAILSNTNAKPTKYV